MIKVCHIVNLITGRADGVYAYLRTIFSSYDRDKYERTLIFQGGSSIEEEMKSMGIKVISVPQIDKKFPFHALISLRKILRENNPDIIHAHMIKPYLISGMLNIFLKKKLIFNYHGLFIKNNEYYSSAEKKLLLVVHTLICKMNAVSLALVPSEKSREMLLEETHLFPEVRSYYTGYDARKIYNNSGSSLSPAKEILSNKKVTVGLVGRFEREKRFDRAAEILCKVKEIIPELRVEIFGEGPLEEKIRDAFKNKLLQESTHFNGVEKNRNALYQKLNLLLITSDREGMPNIIWEAMAFGIPVVASDVGGIKEIIETENCGFVYAKEDISDAAEKVIKIISNHELYQSMKLNGIEAIQNKYNSKNFIKHLEKICSELTGK